MRELSSYVLTYLRNARSCYERWGALGKVKQLDECYPHLHEEWPRGSRTATIAAPVGHLDVETVFKASQALSGEIVLPNLIATLLRISIEHAGAERGLLVLLRDGEPRIEAEATTGGGTVEVSPRDAAVASSVLPESVLHFVIRTRESVILDDASTREPFSQDPYIRQTHARSVLCLPMVKQAQLIGALYLENSLTPGAFTSGHLAVLELLASQAAISLENARLYADLRLENVERKEAQDRLRRSEAFLTQAQSLSRTGSFGWRPSIGEVYWSGETFRIYEIDRAATPTVELVALQRVHPADVAAFRKVLERAAHEGRDYSHEYRLLMLDGRVKHLLVVARAERDDSDRLEFIGAVVDVTERKLAEAELRRSEEQWRDVFENNPTMYFMVDARCKVIAVNPLGAEQLGYHSDDLVGRSLLGLMHESDREAVRRYVAICLEQLGAALGWEARKVHKDGQVLWVRETAKAVSRANGPIVLIACEDVTERKRVEAEKGRLEAQLRQSQKMEAMGTLAGGIAHDFNNILGAILGYGELAQTAAPAGGAVRRYLDNVMNAGGRGKALVERILTFSRSSVGQRGPINVQAAIEETLELLAASLAPGMRLDKRLQAGDAAVVGDATQLHQIAMNLCTNALQAMQRGGVLQVALDRADVAQDGRLSHGNLAPGGYVRLCVSDTGSGIPPQVLDRMFDPFFTTKGAGQGTGLGLSLVHAIVADLGGAIDVCTAVGRGTTFTIWLPTAGEAALPSLEVTAELPRGHGETVMIVDDETPLVALTEEILAELGYEPIGFSSSAVALEAFRAAPQRFDVVLTDETMPEIIGTDFAREIALQRPDIPIVLMSGYAGAQLQAVARAAGILEVLHKPLRRKDIAECLGRVLRNLPLTGLDSDHDQREGLFRRRLRP